MDPATGQGEQLKLVVPWDPAVLWPHDPDEASKAWKAYNNGRAFETLAFKEGSKPTVFTTRRLRSSEMVDVDSHGTDEMRWRVAFMVGVVDVLTPEGERVRPASGSRWTSDEIETFGYAAHNDIGKVIATRSRLPLGLRANYVLPPSSVAASVAFHFPPAEPSPPGVGPSKSPPADPSGT
jgi:hypothetical protein